MKYTAWLDFGTTNSTIWFNNWLTHWLIELWDWKKETRTALFYDEDERKCFVWDSWILNFMEWSNWRLIQSLKSFLSTPEEISTYLWWRKMKLSEMIAIIIKDFKIRLEEIIWTDINDVLIWRPVKFSDRGPEFDKLAQDRLEHSAKIAWFKNITFEYEPIAAIYSFRERFKHILQGKNVLVADLWWWTSDFSLVNVWWTDISVLWNNWINVWWDNFNNRLSLKFFSDYFWKWGKYRCLWEDWTIPDSFYFLLSNWKHLHELSDRRYITAINQISNSAYDTTSFGRLQEIAHNNHLWYEYFKMVENTKRGLSINPVFEWGTDFLKSNFGYFVTRDLFNQVNIENISKLRGVIDELMLQSWLKQADIDFVMLTWWTSLIQAVKLMITKIVWEWKILEWETFTWVWEWLVIRSYNSK